MLTHSATSTLRFVETSSFSSISRVTFRGASVAIVGLTVTMSDPTLDQLTRRLTVTIKLSGPDPRIAQRSVQPRLKVRARTRTRMLSSGFEDGGRFPVSRQTPDRAIGLSGAVDWPWPSAPAAEIEFALITGCCI